MDTQRFTILIVAFSIFAAMFSGCARYLKTPPLPAEKLSVSRELEYIVSTDQTDRKKGLVAIVFHTKRGRRIIVRDSIRAERVYSIYQMDSLKTDEDKFNAGLILMHSQDSVHRRTSYNIFDDLEKNGTTVGGRMNGAKWKILVYQ